VHLVRYPLAVTIYRMPRLYTRWERRTTRSSIGFALLAAVLAPLLLKLLYDQAPVSLLAAVAGLTGVAVQRALTAKIRRRRQLIAAPFSSEWERVLQRDVLFFRTLSDDDKSRFRVELKVFLGEKRITGVGTELDDTTRVLTGASAIIPIFGFPEWEWNQISEVLIYPSRFDTDFGYGAASDRTLGMVGTGAMNRIMILSKPDLIQGFRNSGDKRNVGLHEFAHLVDKSDGTIDGIPGIDRRAVGPWLELVRRKSLEIETRDSDIDPYALTNEAEFFAVTTEYFFERPGVMQRKHPELYATLSRVFNQTLADKAQEMVQARKKGRIEFGRNSPCPCGSGNKFKKCCLNKR
jgi:Mlc titration factor MtfA (ptsG expression regulator)